MVVVTADMPDFARLRACRLPELRDEGRFVPGNVAIRDRVRLGRIGPRLTLASVIEKQMVVILSDNESYGESEGVQALLMGLFGIETEAYPSTQVKLAGLNPITSDVRSVLDAFKKRGSAVLSEGLDTDFPKWQLSPPIGLAGVTEVKISGFLQHLIQVEYALATTQDYERFISLLDAEYGRSERVTSEGCTYRWWTSGRVSIRGEHCPGNSDTLTFYNDVASEQLEKIVEKIDEKSDGSSDKPQIDRDMF